MLQPVIIQGHSTSIEAVVNLEDNIDKYPIREIARFAYDSIMNDPNVHLTEEARKALKDISSCKTGELGYNASICPNCHKIVLHTCSCNNRNCPNCQSMEADAWVENKSAETIEGLAYYHGVTTTPSELIPLFNANKKSLFGLLMNSSASAVVTLARDIKHGGFTPAVLSNLHPNGSQLFDHPHVHMLISGGGLDAQHKFVEASHKHFFLPKGAVSSVFRGMFMKGLKKKYDANELVFPAPELFVESMGHPVDLNDPQQWKDYVSHLYSIEWNFFIKETFNGHGNAIRYLGRYVFRTAISNSRIVSTELKSTEDHPEGWVVFKYKDYADGGKWKTEGITPKKFMLRFLRHVMPKGFCRVRSYGLLANSIKQKSLKLIAALRGKNYVVSVLKGKSKTQIMVLLYGESSRSVCPDCHHTLEVYGKFKKDQVDFPNKMAC